MRLMVFPDALRPHVEGTAARAFGHAGAPDGLTLTVVHMPATRDWSVHATGLDDPVLERGLCDVVREALRRAL
jgi:hypothetical protein